MIKHWKVRGRGGLHQIDALADLMIVLPFTYAQRLLLEAKCYSENAPVGIEIICNAVRVLKDVGEYWVARNGIPSKARYHYHYAFFSASNYTKDAEKYAFAHDVYLIPLAQCRFIQPILHSVRQVITRTFGGSAPNEKFDIPMIDSRRAIRATIRNRRNDELHEVLTHYQDALGTLGSFCRACQQVDKAFIAMIAGRFPIFLVPDPSFHFHQINTHYDVSIHCNRKKRERGWYLRSRRTGDILFSFDLPI